MAVWIQGKIRLTRAPLPRLERRNPAGSLARVSTFSRDGIIPTQEPSPSPSATSVPRTCTSCLGARFAVFAGAFSSLQLEPHRFLKCRQLWRRFMQCSFRTSPGGNDETVCFVYSVESHVPEEDDARNVDIRIVSASNASEPSLQAKARADGNQLPDQILGVESDFFHADACSVVSSRTSC